MSKFSIWKFPVSVRDEFKLEMPAGADVLDVQEQGNEAVMWAVVDTTAHKEWRTFRVYGTGHPYVVQNDQYIGTFQQYGGRLVFHLFEVLR